MSDYFYEVLTHQINVVSAAKGHLGQEDENRMHPKDPGQATWKPGASLKTFGDDGVARAGGKSIDQN